MPAASEASPARVWFRIIRLHQRLHTMMAGRLKSIGLSVPQFDVLSTLTEREGMTQRELADRLYVTKGNVSGLIDRLVEAGLVLRQAMAGDRRSHALMLTDEGRRLAALGLDIQKSLIETTLGRLSGSDIRDLDRLLIAWRESVRMLEEKERAAAEETAAPQSGHNRA